MQSGCLAAAMPMAVHTIAPSCIITVSNSAGGVVLARRAFFERNTLRIPAVASNRRD